MTRLKELSRFSLHAMVSLLMVFPALSVSQEKPLKGFWGLDFGSSLPAARKFLLQKEGAKVDEPRSDSLNLYVRGCKFADREPSFLLMQFGKSGLHTAMVFFHFNDTTIANPFFDALKSEIELVYGKVPIDYSELRVPIPLRPPDASKLHAGPSLRQFQWQFTQKGGGINYITLSMSEGAPQILLVYQDGKLVKKALQEWKSKKSDL